MGNVRPKKEYRVMPLPKIIDNERSSMLDVLRTISKDHEKLSIATGYWDLGAISLLLEELDSLKEIRLLIGREPLIPRHKLKNPEIDFPGQDFQFDLANVNPGSDVRKAADKVTEWIASEKLKVKVFTRTFLHAKTYIFGDFKSDNAVGVIGSSNFTKNGLTQNTELNALEDSYKVVLYEPKTAAQETGHLSWFEGMWNDEFAIDWTQKFGEILETSPVGNKFFSPFETYIKTLYTLYREELEDVAVADPGKKAGRTLFDFQQKNTQALQRRLNKYGVAMLADSVGLGKTSTAINVIRNYFEDPTGRKRIEIICPKSIVQQWEKELATEGIHGQKPITLQNANEIEQRKELDQIASVSLFVIDESHNLRQTSGFRFQQLVEWVRSNPKAHVLLLTATPINNNLSDLTNQILLGTGGNAEVMKITVSEKRKQTTYITFHQAVENLRKKINQDLKRDGQIDFDAIRQVMTPIIRTFVVRRTRQGIQQEYGTLTIDGVERSFPKVIPGLIEYAFAKENVEAIRNVKCDKVDLDHIYQVSPVDLMEKCKDLSHPYDQALNLKKAADAREIASQSPMFYVFQIILLLGFMPYRWMMYQTKYHGKTREQISELRLPSEESKKLLLQLGIFGILRTVFLKRMESSVSALRNSLGTYQAKLLAFERGVKQGLIVSVSDLRALEDSLGDEDLDVDAESLAEQTLASIDPKSFNVDALLRDIEREKALISLLDNQLEILAKDDTKIKEFAQEIDKLRSEDPNRKILVFSYFSDTVRFLQDNLFKYSKSAKPDNSGFLTSGNRADAENLASRFSPVAKIYELKSGEQELDLLVSTDVLSEGQNLQDAGVLINFDLHWNPVRMIQRNGRVNRLGSTFEEVNVFNMKPEAELDGYLKLIQRLEGKINIIRNTIGTDTPVLEEPENPIEYADAVSDIYSHDMQKRLKALDDAERAADYLLSEDEFVMDLKKFAADPGLTDEYKRQIFGMSPGKWALLPSDEKSRPSIIGLSGLYADDNLDQLVGHRFVEIDATVSSVKSLSSLRALELLRTSSQDSARSLDRSKLDKEKVRNLINLGSMAYSENDEIGAPIGQEKEILRILFAKEYSEDEINLVRDAFRTKDVFLKRDIESIKRQIMAKSKRGEIFQEEIRALLLKAGEIARLHRDAEVSSVASSLVILAYMNADLNAK
jgi:ERCC4-related helicase